MMMPSLIFQIPIVCMYLIMTLLPLRSYDSYITTRIIHIFIKSHEIFLP